MNIRRFIKPVYAHCDLPCGVYDPAQAKIEADAILKIMEKYESLTDEDRIRAVLIKEQRAELVKNHLWILWTDYFKPEHVLTYPHIHELFWLATKQAGLTKKTFDKEVAIKLLGQIDEITNIFWATKKE
ncbi:MAG: superoxide dismutase, Ni [Candidatus Saccharimonadales bacterium]